jgi:flagellar assembly protein FliH
MSSRIWSADEIDKAKVWRADALVTPAAPKANANDLESRRRDAREQGYRDGFAQGVKEGQAKAKADAAQIAHLVASARDTCEALEARVADQVVDLAIEIARQVLRSDPKLKREALAEVAREALGHLAADAAQPQVVLHPADVATLKAHMGEELARGAWSLVEDLRMEPGGFRIVTSSGEVDATMATRWRRVLAMLGRDGSWRVDNE